MMHRFFGNGNFGNGNFGNGNLGNGNFCNGTGAGRCLGFGAFHGEWMIAGIVILIILALLFYFFVHNRKKKEANHEALDILKMKYVKGEITEEEYLKSRKVIEKN